MGARVEVRVGMAGRAGGGWQGGGEGVGLAVDAVLADAVLADRAHELGLDAVAFVHEGHRRAALLCRTPTRTRESQESQGRRPRKMAAARGPVKNPPPAPSSATPNGTAARHTGPVIRRRAVDEILQLPATEVLGLHAHGEADRIHEVRLACRAEVGAYGTAGALVPAGAPSPERPALLPRLPLCAPAPFGPTTAEKSKKGPSVVLPP